jgi:hypothetical protein
MILEDFPPEILAIIVDALTYRRPNGDTMALLLTGNVNLNKKLDLALRQIVVKSSIKQKPLLPSCFDKYISHLFECVDLQHYSSNRVIELCANEALINNPSFLGTFGNLKKLFTRGTISNLEIIRQLPHLQYISFLADGVPNDVVLPNIIELQIYVTNGNPNYLKPFPNLEKLFFDYGHYVGINVNRDMSYCTIDLSSHKYLRELRVFELSDRYVVVEMGNIAIECLNLWGGISIDINNINCTKLREFKFNGDDFYLDYHTGTYFPSNWLNIFAKHCGSNLEVLDIHNSNVNINGVLNFFTNLRKFKYNYGVDFDEIVSKKVHEIDCGQSTYVENKIGLLNLPTLRKLTLHVGHTFDLSVFSKLNLSCLNVYVNIDIIKNRIVEIIPFIIHITRVRISTFTINSNLYDSIIQNFIKHHKGISTKSIINTICRNFSLSHTFTIDDNSHIVFAYRKKFQEFIKLGYMDSFGDE